MEQWEVKRSGGRCAGTQRELDFGEEYYAALIDTETGFERQDFCCEYWEKQQPSVFSYWKTRVPMPNEKKKLFVDNDILVNFFERLAEETEEIKVNFRFVLALILMRKRRLKYEDTVIVAGKEIWRMRFVRETNTHEVINPQLDDAQIDAVSQELSSILHGEV